MLAKDPERRYATPQEAANALRGFLTAKEMRGRAVGAARIGTNRQMPSGPPQSSSLPTPSSKIPVAVPVLAAPVSPAPVNPRLAPPVGADVELVTDVVGETQAPSLTAEWSRREWLIFTIGMAVGGGGVLALGGLGFLGAKLLWRRRRDTEGTTPVGSDGAGAE
jgi:hypothetical protein